MSINYIDLDGEQVSQAEYCRRLGYNYHNIHNIMCRYKISFEEAIEESKKPKNERKWVKRVSKDKTLRQKWHDMMDRCYNPKNHAFIYYGGKKPTPIKVCERWHDYFNFEDDMYESFIEHVEKYGLHDTTLDRFPNKEGDYEPANIRWATRKEQNNNMTTNHMITDDLNLSQFCKVNELSYNLIKQRLQHGWTIDEAITNKRPTLNSVIKEVAELLNISPSTIKYRLKIGWSWSEIINTPVKKPKVSSSEESVAQLAKRIGVSVQTVYRRLKEGYTRKEIEDNPLKYRKNKNKT